MSWTDASQPLVISSYTLGTEVSFEDRVRIAAETGFAGVGLRAENYWAARGAGLDDAAMLAVLERHGVAVMEVEYITGWGTEADRDAAQQDKERAVYHMARTFGVSHLNAGLLERLPIDVVTDTFAELCRRAGESTVGLEFMPYSECRTSRPHGPWSAGPASPTAPCSWMPGTGAGRGRLLPTSNPYPRTASSRSNSATSGSSRWSSSGRSPWVIDCRRDVEAATWSACSAP